MTATKMSDTQNGRRWGRAALDAAPPEGPSLEEVEDLCEEHCFNVEGYESVECLQGLLNDAISRWGRPATPPAPAAGEVGELVSWLDVVSEQFRLAELYDEATQTDRAAALLKQLSAAQDPQPPAGWQPIDTAPRDGTEILASDYDAIEIVSWQIYGSASNWESRYGDAMFPAWWQPLADHPPLPATTPAGREGADA